MSVRLTIIIPGYNTPKEWWCRSVESVIMACGPNDEIICVEDGSVRKELPKFGDKRVKYIFLKENSGQSVARNKALSIAKGKWVTFVDSDDAIKRDTYNRCFDRINQTEPDILVFGVDTIWTNIGLWRRSLPPINMEGELTPEKAKLLNDEKLFESPVNKIYRKEFLKRHNIIFPQDICPGEDTMFVLSCLKHRAIWDYVSYAGYIYYRVDGTTLSRYMPNLHNTLLYWRREWQEYKRMFPLAAKFFNDFAQYSDEMIIRAEWMNIWRRGSSKSIFQKWKFAVKYKKEIGSSVLYSFLKMIVYSFCRKHFYFRFIQKWHIKRVFCDVKEMNCYSN